MTDVYIVSAKRTPIGSFGGKLSGFSAVELGNFASQAAINEIKISPEQIDEVFYGNVCSANLGQAPARQVALGSGLPYSVPCTTINKVCSSGLKSVMIGTQSLQSGDNAIILTGGMESMSNIPYYLNKARWGHKYGHGEIIDGLQKDGLSDAYDQNAMGICADATAAKYNISRAAQDEYAINSYKKASSATENGKFKNEIVGVSIPQRKGDPVLMDEDEEFRNVNYDKVPTLRPVFTKEGTVTAANASTINDGAATLLLATEAAVKKYNLKPLCRIVSFADAAQEPQWFTTTPPIAARLALKRAQLSIDDIDLFEVNEAFAVVAQAFIKDFDLDDSKVNVYGGAVALGHPLGASGARILITLISALHDQKAKYGLAAICNGGGGASSMIIETI